MISKYQLLAIWQWLRRPTLTGVRTNQTIVLDNARIKDFQCFGCDLIYQGGDLSFDGINKFVSCSIIFLGKAANTRSFLGFYYEHNTDQTIESMLGCSSVRGAEHG